LDHTDAYFRINLKNVRPKEKSKVGKRDWTNKADRERGYRNKKSEAMNDRDIDWQQMQTITENLHRKLLWQGEKSSADLSDCLTQKPHHQEQKLSTIKEEVTNMVNQESIFNVRDRN
jgi:hypothetical protein